MSTQGRVGFLALAALLSFGTMQSAAESHARIVRLSSVEGDVQIDRNAGNGYEKAFLNMPLVQGATLATKADARAEVEFEDGSTLRLTPNSTLEFSELALSDSGARMSTLTLKTGQVYVNYGARQKTDQFALVFAKEKIVLSGPVHFRADLEEASAEVAVFKGDLKVDGPSGTAELSRNKSATFDLAEASKFAIASNVEEDPYDAWDKRQEKYHDQYASNKSYNDYPYSYGVSDLNYYGNYSNVPGYGWMWQPYFAGAGWNPFADGAWMYYPGFGYTWVSGYPWGWMPYNYGSWTNVPGYGWMWQPGYWNGWTPVPRVTNPPQRNAAFQPPSTGTGTVVVGRGLTGGTGIPPRRVVVQPGMAGYGIPRGNYDLNKVSRQVQQQGFATLHTTAPNRMGAPMGTSGGFGNAPNHGGSMSSGSSAGHMSSGSGGHTSPPSRH